MKTCYQIVGLCPRTDISLGRCGFGIKLWPSWKESVAEYNKTQAQVNSAIENLHRSWLDGCGFNQMFDPDNCGAWKEDKPPGPNSHHLYGPHHIRISWGEWGPEHITVPGNACGLDLCDGIGKPRGGAYLGPHNVDTIAQAHLLLVIFTWFAEGMALEEECRSYRNNLEFA